MVSRQMGIIILARMGVLVMAMGAILGTPQGVEAGLDEAELNRFLTEYQRQYQRELAEPPQVPSEAPRLKKQAVLFGCGASIATLASLGSFFYGQFQGSPDISVALDRQFAAGLAMTYLGIHAPVLAALSWLYGTDAFEARYSESSTVEKIEILKLLLAGLRNRPYRSHFFIGRYHSHLNAHYSEREPSSRRMISPDEFHKAVRQFVMSSEVTTATLNIKASWPHAMAFAVFEALVAILDPALSERRADSH